MITVSNAKKSFDKTVVLENLDCHVKKGSIYGLIGSNGAGKSTLLNILCGVYKTEDGSVKISGEEVYENITVKEKIAYISDDPYFFNSSTMREMALYLNSVQPKFTIEKFEEIVSHFPLDINKKINSFSKGMKRQAAIVLALSQNPDVLLCDESFDGLDPVIRQLVKRLLIREVSEREMTVIISSHNLSEMENLCDTIAILHDNKIILERSIDEIKDTMHHYQLAFKPMIPVESFSSLDVISHKIRSNIIELVVKGDGEKIEAEFNRLNPILIDKLELTLEDIFVYEMEVSGYDYTKILM